MLGKPMQISEARDLNQNGLKIVSCYQYGKESSADWLGGQSAGVAARPARVAAAHRRRRSRRRPHLRLDRRRPVLRAVQAAGSALSARLGVGDRPPADRRVRQLQNDRMGAARRPGLLLLAAQLGLTRVAALIPPRICTRSRSTSATSAASAWTSTTSASRNSASGPERADPRVSFQQTSAGRSGGRFSFSRRASASSDWTGDARWSADFQDNDCVTILP